MPSKYIMLFLFLALSTSTAGQDFHLVFLNKKENKKELSEEEVKKLMEGHMANIGRLAKEGKLWAAGPFDGGGGIFILKTSKLDSVKRWILTDPAVAAERWDVELFPYYPGIGGVCSVGEKFEMTNYFMVRYHSSANGKKNAAWKKHRKFLGSWLQAGKVIAEGNLGDQDAILILKDEPTSESLSTDPLVTDGGFQPTIKKLFIAKGSFCEPR